MRVISALVLAPCAIAVLWLGGAAWDALIALAALLLVHEWVRLCGGEMHAPAGIALAIALTATVAAAAVQNDRWALVLIPAGAVVSWALARAGRGVESRRRRIARPGSLAAGAAYIGLPAIAMVWLRQDPLVGWANLLFLILVVWSSDVGAYVAGRVVGGRRLAPSISPGKTWAGAAGGLLAAILVGYVVAMPLTHDGRGAASFGRIAAVAAYLAVVAQLGDLLESFIKRRFGVKDTGGLIPGHGGLLDRLDGVLTAAPAASLLALALGRGVLLWQ